MSLRGMLLLYLAKLRILGPLHITPEWERVTLFTY
jgi:hypothetical protein